MKTNMFGIFRNPKPNENYIIKRQSSKDARPNENYIVP
jgi:hypothetical protein